MNNVAQPCRVTRGYKKFALQAVEDLGYPRYIIDKIRNAKSDFEISNIMNDAAKRIQDPE